MAELIMEAQGEGKKISLYQNKVVIGGKKGMMGVLMAGGAEQTIRVRDIRAVEFKNAGSVINGYIQFSTGSSAKSGGGGILAVVDAGDEPNTVHFAKKAQDDFDTLKDKVEEMMDSLDNQGSVTAPTSADELKKYGDLLKEGLISQEEFDQKKKEILGL